MRVVILREVKAAGNETVSVCHESEVLSFLNYLSDLAAITSNTVYACGISDARDD
jgi:hypothetical protein